MVSQIACKNNIQGHGELMQFHHEKKQPWQPFGMQKKIK
jgi:hypothetical protein